ncbi:MAG: hypothetical protein K9H64_01505 [Bacteroidales bacterium]|nr:hypothetical protein [Bacteroidales bacterium]MCF8454580.1 hypothetical protein [Bacteroidales bacterium]
MKINLLISIFILISSLCAAQESIPEFSGCIKYQSATKYLKKSYFSSELESKEYITYYKKGCFRTDYYFDDIITKTIFVFADSSYSYHHHTCRDIIYAYPLMEYNENWEFIKSNNRPYILDNECSQIVIKDNSQIDTLSYSLNFPMRHPVADKFLSNRIYSAINAMVLDHIIEIKGVLRSSDSAKEIVEMELDDSIFFLPSNNIVYDPNPDSINYNNNFREIADGFMACGNYNSAIYFYN